MAFVCTFINADTFWAWLRLGKSPWWIVPGVLSLCIFAYLLTLPDADLAGRSYAAYGGVYIASAVLWLWIVKGARPDHWGLLSAVNRQPFSGTSHKLALHSECGQISFPARHLSAPDPGA
ncbi:YnfA family protein [Sphingobium sp. CFD-2]|uniref:YnfA family protein n=1 Tax=Sphingobium sp. CFD-2 TaxID=2878542 RepID=UPI00214C2E04|nr:hypothetical protein [Sphingobium sp. CFD-2]